MPQKELKALFTFLYDEQCMQKIKDLGIHVEYIPESAMNAPDFKLDKKIEDIDLMVCYNPFPHMELKNFTNLKFIQLVSVGFNHVPADQIKAQNIKICHNVGTTRYPISEWILTQILQIYKNTRLFTKQQQQKVWKSQHDILELTDKVVLFLGGGNIARESARKLKAFDAVTYALDLSDKPADNMDRVFTIDRIDEILPQADVVVNTLPATKDTFHLLNRNRLKSMKNGSALVSFSRGTVIDESALIEEIQYGHFRGVAMDVFETEPLPAASPLWDFDCVYITPHNAIFSDLYDRRVGEMVYENLRHFTEGSELSNPVHFDRGF